MYYKIENVQHLPPFFMTVASASDMWMFFSSNGAITAGRQNQGASIFPYETDDRMHLATSTGSKTLVRLADGRVWQPFSAGFNNPYTIKRSISKRNTGDAVVFEEINETLGIAFSCRWETGEKFGIVRTTEVKNVGDKAIQFEILDGVENIMPYGVPGGLAATLSCLTDAYKASERPGNGRLATYSITSTIGDTVEPIEVLRATVAWYIGEADAYALSSRQISAFAAGQKIENEVNTAGRKGAFFTSQNISLAPNAEKSWMMVFDARLSQHQVSALLKLVNGTPIDKLRKDVETDVAQGTEELKRIVAASDGFQQTGNPLADIRHYMNTLYNNMRGGVFLDGYSFDPVLFENFLNVRNKGLAQRKAAFVASLKANQVTDILKLHELAHQDGDADLIRLTMEFLPLTFSRRHGDPSRPWNYFHIRVKDDDGNRLYHYEGNWRDIFQNWEAITLSNPGYLAPIIAKFLNASTPDGFNPYRINHEGIDWEVPNPHEPWDGFGYWGDHQIVYLNKLLEWLEAYAPTDLAKLAAGDTFTYANIPYEIKSYQELVKNGKHTIHFNFPRHDSIIAHAKEYGTDGRLVMDGDDVYKVSFLEKLLVPILSKLSNLVPGGGIWMNTQRPEWNDANNAIVGNGLSMVTIYQMYRHLGHCLKLAQSLGGEIAMSKEVKTWLVDIFDVLVKGDISPRQYLDTAGEAFGKYRKQVYANGFSGKETITAAEIANFLEAALDVLAKTIDANKRPDGMYHSYNILTLTDGGLNVSPMFLMLEGQTAVMGSGKLTPQEALDLTLAMENSDLWNPLLKQFFLYPVKTLHTFMERNIIPSELAAKSPLITRLLAERHEGFVLRDETGEIRFHHTIEQSSDVENRLAAVNASPQDADIIRDIYEQVFAHKQFTGRSGIMYKFEGIGCIFWHQNSKFMLGLQEMANQAFETDDKNATALKDAYYRLQQGFGFCHDAKTWGAFPLEPHSHTPLGMPAQQPGMTGQAKEDILTRLAELGVTVDGGVLSFDTAMLRKQEFLPQPSVFKYYDVNGKAAELAIPANSLAFTICQVPVVYTLADENAVLVNSEKKALDLETSRAIFSRNGSVKKIEVLVNM